jgi:hypothetical protein
MINPSPPISITIPPPNNTSQKDLQQ